MAKQQYRVRNWHAYNDALLQRGSLTLWLSDDVSQGWLAAKTGCRGRPPLFSDTAIRCALTMRAVFRLPLRQTEGFLKSVLAMMRLPLPVPDYSTLSLRAAHLAVALPRKKRKDEEIHLILDSTGLKIRGDGEWRRKRGKSAHRKWRKWHIGIDADSGEIVVQELSLSRVHDATAGVRLIKAASDPLTSVTADGSYDKVKIYDACDKQAAAPVIPPQKNAKIYKGWKKDVRDGKWKQYIPYLESRHDAIRAMRKGGRKRWKKESGYHRRSLVETAFSRLIRLFGPALRSKRMARQRTEVGIRSYVLNTFTALGMPETIRIA